MRRIDICASYSMINELVDLDRIEGFIRQRITIDGEASSRDFGRKLEEVMGDAVKILVKEPIIDIIQIKQLNENHKGEKLSIQTDYAYSLEWDIRGINELYLPALFWWTIREIRKRTKELNIDISVSPSLCKWTQETFAPVKNLLVDGETYVVSKKIMNLLFEMIQKAPPANNGGKMICNIVPYNKSYLIVDTHASGDYVMHLPKTKLWMANQVNVMICSERTCTFGHEIIIEPEIQYPTANIIGLAY